MANIKIGAKELTAALKALKRTDPVLNAYKQGGYIVIYFCGSPDPVRWKPPTKTKRTTTAPRKAASKKAATTPKE